MKKTHNSGILESEIRNELLNLQDQVIVTTVLMIILTSGFRKSETQKTRNPDPE